MPARLRMGVLTGLAALASILLISACGGASKPKRTSGSANVFIAFSKCMRAHGVSGFPDPIISQESPTALNPANCSSIEAGGGMIIAIPKSIDEGSPAFQKAAKACRFNGG